LQYDVPLSHASSAGSASRSSRAGSVSRIALLSVHTSPLEQPGIRNAGGLNVYVTETARLLAARGVEVEIFTRAEASDLPPVVTMSPGVTVRHVQAGPFGGLSTTEVPAQLCTFLAGLLRTEAGQDPGYYDLIHSHYWLSGHVGRLARERWGIPLVHSAHTLAKVKNAHRGADEAPEPAVRLVGEEQIVASADRLVAATDREAQELIQLYGADPRAVAVIPPGVDLDGFRPGDKAAAREALGIGPDAAVAAYVGRLQPHKAPDLLIRAAALLRLDRPLQVLIVGGSSGQAYGQGELPGLVRDLGLEENIRFCPPMTRDELALLYQASDVLVMPSRSESFGLAALEAQACGTPVVATPVGGLKTAVEHDVSGLLTRGHEPEQIAEPLRRILTDPQLARRLGRGAVKHASQYSWERTVDGLMQVYREVLE
jgi:D-inositol-3-phosphate glycosyltransferase